MELSVSVSDSVLKRIGSAETVRHILECVGQSVENAAVIGARAHGGRRFWASIANSVSHKVNGDGVTVGASHYAAAFKQFGGTITAPGRGPGSLHRKALTIPVGIARQAGWDTDEAESHGYTLFRQKDIIFGSMASKARKPAAGAKRKTKQRPPKVIPLFVLRKAVTQKAYPWFPEGQTLNDAISTAVDFFSSRHGGAPV